MNDYSGTGLLSRSFGITILDAGQQEICDRFAGRVSDDLERLDGLETITLVSGVPLLKQGFTHLDCQVVTAIGSGTHTIFIAEVLFAQSVEDGDPLLYFNRDYWKIQKPSDHLQLLEGK
jgi:flavin reductase (DIM6/NTAB) family NADH-FMN oxidoreductase RutF